MTEDMEDVSSVDSLSRIEEALQQYQQQETKGTAGIVGGIVAFILVLVIVTALAYQAWLNGKEKAKILHELAVKEEEAHQAKLTADIAEKQEVIDASLAKANEFQVRADYLKEQALILESDRKRINARIDKLTSWSAIDAVVKK